MERRSASQAHYEFVQKHRESATEYERTIAGWLSFRRSKAPVLTAELDEDSFFLAFSEWGSFVEHSLGRYAQTHSDIVASVYTYSTGRSPSANYSDGEGHRRVGWHNACFIGVVGRDKQPILDTIALALTSQVGVPEGIVESRLKDPAKQKQISCRNPSEHILFKTDPSWHIEDGLCWAPEEKYLVYARGLDLARSKN